MTAPRPDAGGGGRHRASADPAERGTLTISDGAVDTLVAVTLAEVDGVGGAARRVLGVSLGSDGDDRRPRASSTVSGGRVGVEATIAVDYPRPVAATVERARAHLAARVGELTGLTVDRVDLTVGAFTSADDTPRRRELS